DNPGLTPNQLKARLLGTTNPGPVGNPFVDGHGALNAYAAANADPVKLRQSAFGLLAVLPGMTLSLTHTGSPPDTWNATRWTALSSPQPPASQPRPGDSWDGGEWNGHDWTSRAW